MLLPLGALACLLPSVTTGMGLLAGLALALIVGNPYLPHTRKVVPKLLAAAVVGLGAGMDLRAVARAGLAGVGYTAASIAVCLALGWFLARAFRVAGATGLLISVGTAICGGSAIAAVVPVIRAREEEASVALGTVFVLNAVALFLFPWVGHARGLSDSQFGLWAAVAIHDTSSVVGAAVSYGAQAVEVATPVKLARALWIVPLTLGIAFWHRRTTGEGPLGKPKRPWFILGFLVAAAAATYVPGLWEPGQLAARVARQVLVLTLFLIGANLTPQALRTVGWRPFAQGLCLWIAMATLSLFVVGAAPQEAIPLATGPTRTGTLGTDADSPHRP